MPVSPSIESSAEGFFRMKAILLEKPGGPEALRQVIVPTPRPRSGEVLIKAEAIGVGRADVLVRAGTYKWMPPLPVTPGAEMVGTVDAVGPGVTALELGQRVLISARELPQRSGCYAQYVCVPEGAPFALPSSIAPADALHLPNLQLANAMLCGVSDRAQTALIPGAAGAVATALVQVATCRGIAVIGTASTQAKRDFARANGVSTFVESVPDHLPQAVLEMTGGRGVDLAFDHLGGEHLTACLRSLAPLGMLISFNAIKGPPPSDVFLTMRELLGRSLTLRTFSMHAYDENRDIRRGLMQLAIDQLASGAVRVPAPKTFRLGEVAQAHTALDEGSSFGKIVLLP